MAQILIVDDDPATLILLKRALTRSGYEVILAHNGSEGIEQAQKFSPALIICDWLMPGVDGLEVCRQIKSTKELSTTFFILLTSLGSVEDRVKGLDAGADDFLCKPIDINELQARVRASLRLHQLSYDLQQQKLLLETELAEAADYVCSILPEPLLNPYLSIDFRFIPSRQLGGDSFDYYWLDKEHLVIYLLDVSGHGLRAALPSLSVINLLRSKGLNPVNYYCPSDVLKALNKAFPMTPRNDKYFTIWYGVYHYQTRKLTYSTAGHPPAILLSRCRLGQILEQRLKIQGFPVGMFEDSDYQDAQCQIKPGDSIYLFSDGVYEIEKDGKILGLNSFIELLKKYHELPKHNLNQLIQNLQTLQVKSNFDDDLLIMQIDFHH